MPQPQSATSNIPGDDEALERYQQEIAQHPLLPLKKETELLRRISKGGDDGREAMQKLVAAKLRFVVAAAKQFKGRGISIYELVEMGKEELQAAAKEYDAECDIKFIVYAANRIRHKFHDAVAELEEQTEVVLKRTHDKLKELARELHLLSRMVHQSSGRMPFFIKKFRFIAEYQERHGHAPTDEEIAEALGIDVEQAKAIK